MKTLPILRHISFSIAFVAFCALHAQAQIVSIDAVSCQAGFIADAVFSRGGSYLSEKGKARPEGVATNPADPSDTTWLYFEALQWLGVDDQKGLDTMRLYIERFPHYRGDNTIISAIQYTSDFTANLAKKDTYVDFRYWKDNYDWLTTIYSLDTARRYQSTVLMAMATAEGYFDRNGAANLWWNISILFPPARGTALDQVTQTRNYQKQIHEDTTPFYRIKIPPVPYGQSAVSTSGRVSNLEVRISPNPASRMVAVHANLPQGAYGSAVLYDELGNEVLSIKRGSFSPGANELSFDCSAIPAGNYFLRVATAAEVRTVRLGITK